MATIRSAGLMILLAAPAVLGDEGEAGIADSLYSAFSHKLIFSETPDAGVRWRGGIKLRLYFFSFDGEETAGEEGGVLPLPQLDFFWNMGGILTLDMVIAGIPRIAGDNGDTIQDSYSLMSIKSKPFSRELRGLPWRIAGGAKLYSASSQFQDSLGEGLPRERDGAVGVFVTQDVRLGRRHRGNLYTSVNFRRKRIGSSPTLSATWFVVPGYRLSLDQCDRWSLGLEYYLMNPEKLPIKFIQYAADEDRTEFHNINRSVVTFLFWGGSYHSRRVRVDFTLGHHPTFQGPVIPSATFGWNF